MTIGAVVTVLVVSFVAMSLMPQSFFPKMDKPYFRADLLYPEGFSIHAVDNDVRKVEAFLSKDKRVKEYAVTLGGTPLRYYLASSSFGPKSNYANVMVETHKSDDAPEVEKDFYEYMTANHPDVITRSALFALSPVPEAAIEIGFIGEDTDTLTALVGRAIDIARRCSLVTDIRSSWGTKVPVWKPKYSQQKGLRLGITRQQMANSLRTTTNGLALGEYREGDLSLPILLKIANHKDMSVNDIGGVPVFSTKGRPVSINQVTDRYTLDYEYHMVRRYNRERCMMMQCEPLRGGNTMEAFRQVMDSVAAGIILPDGYRMKYFGEQDTQDVSNAALGKYVPLTFLLIYTVLLLLFPTHYSKPLIIMLMLPLIFIGVAWGLILTGKSFDFFSILGLLGLIGMNIKNAIVLVDEIGLQQQSQSTITEAVVEATKTRIVPVTMASGTTILGMVPLLGDSMFAGMAATIMGGLFASTLLTIFVLPVAYVIIIRK
jgi:multidrug efflux pump subunit AcrB